MRGYFLYLFSSFRAERSGVEKSPAIKQFLCLKEISPLRLSAPVEMTAYFTNVSEFISFFISSMTFSRYCPYWFFSIG